MSPLYSGVCTNPECRISHKQPSILYAPNIEIKCRCGKRIPLFLDLSYTEGDA